MDPIELVYDNMSAVPAAFKDLYTEKDGKAVLTHVMGMKTQADVDAVKEALRKERVDHEKARNDLKPWANWKFEEVNTKLSRFDELEAASKGKMDESKIEEIVNGRLKLKTGPLEQTLAERDAALKAALDENIGLKNSIADRDLNDRVREISAKMKVIPTAVEDVTLAAKSMMQKDETGKLVTKDGLSIPAGLDLDGFMKAMFKARPHWWPESEGGGSRGGNGGGGISNNPWSAEHWSLTEQGKIYNSEGQQAAERYAKQAGVFLGATGPKAKA